MSEILCWLDAALGFLENHNAAITAVATVAIAWFTVALSVSTRRLWKEAKTASEIANRASLEAKRSADLAEAALVAGERAFVFPTGVFSLWERGPEPNLYYWRFRAIWTNSWETPTNNL